MKRADFIENIPKQKLFNENYFKKNTVDLTHLNDKWVEICIYTEGKSQ